MSIDRKTRILQVMGSPVDLFDYNLSVLNGKNNVKASYDKINGYEYVFAVVHPGGDWSFPLDIDETNSQRFKLDQAVKIIENMSPDVILSHLLCIKAPAYLSIFELLNIPIIGPTAEIFTTVTNKATSRGLMQAFGLRIPQGLLIDEQTRLDKLDISYPCVVKPPQTENSIGISLVYSKDELVKALDIAFNYGSQILIEKFIPGREIRTCVIENSEGEIIPLPCLEYKINQDDIRRFEDKLEYRDDGKIDISRSSVKEFLSEKTEPLLVKRLQKITIKNHRALKCRDFSLLDCRVTESGEVYILESNVFASLSPSSVINKMVRNMGMTDSELMDMMVKNALKRSLV